MNTKKTLAMVLVMFAIIIVTTVTSFAFFTYSKVGKTKITITAGDIDFTFEEGQDATFPNAFPVADTVGAVDKRNEYLFDVKLSSTSNSSKANYNVILLDNNKLQKNYFTNDQIKFALIKNDTYVANTTAENGRLMSSIEGFNASESIGEGTVLTNQEITSGNIDKYKLRLWISDSVKYTNGNEKEAIGKYNGYLYSLKVKVVTSENNL